MLMLLVVSQSKVYFGEREKTFAKAANINNNTSWKQNYICNIVMILLFLFELKLTANAYMRNWKTRRNRWKDNASQKKKNSKKLRFFIYMWTLNIEHTFDETERSIEIMENSKLMIQYLLLHGAAFCVNDK